MPPTHGCDYREKPLELTKAKEKKGGGEEEKGAPYPSQLHSGLCSLVQYYTHSTQFDLKLTAVSEAPHCRITGRK